MSGEGTAFGAPLRARFAIAPDLALLNHGSFGACPREVLAVARAEQDACEADPIAFMTRVPDRLRAAADVVGRHLGAHGRDLAFVENATTAVNTVLRSRRFEPGDRLVTTTHVYGAVREALRFVARRWGAEVVEVPVPFPIQDPRDVLAALEPHLEGAAFAVVDAITSPTGLVLPYAELVAACRAHGVPVMVDAAHAPGQIPLDLGALGADFVTGNLHKWAFAPKGCAVLWVAPDRHDEVQPLSISHDADAAYPHPFDWTGTKDFSAWLAAPAALRFLDALGPERVREHNDTLAHEAAGMLAEAWGVHVPSPRSMRAAMAAVPAPGDLPASASVQLHDALAARRIEVPCVPFGGRTWVRISGQVYNRWEEYERLASTVVEIVRDR